MPRPARLSLELLESFVVLMRRGGDAGEAADELDVNAPSMSKRLSALRGATERIMKGSWLVRKGKKWKLTAEGERVLPVVAQFVDRYDDLLEFLVGGADDPQTVTVACGRQAVGGFVRSAVQEFRVALPDCRVRVSTPDGRDRILGVAGGRFDLACVTDTPETIQRVAQHELFIETLLVDRFVLAANPTAGAAWGKRWKAVVALGKATAADLADLPFILPEGDRGRRKQFDDWTSRAVSRRLDVVVELGGWQAILDYAAAGLGVGLVPASAVATFLGRGAARLTALPLDEADFPPDDVRLIARKTHGRNEPTLSPPAARFRDALLKAAKLEG
ncbi:MAG: LysR family transcriptional regulator [Planctomycetia bacterium]